MQYQYAVIHEYEHVSRTVSFPQREVRVVGKCMLSVEINPEDLVVHMNRTEGRIVGVQFTRG